MIRWPDHVFGSVPNDLDANSPAHLKDYINCARQHCEAKSILSVDIKDFFDNIHFDTVKGIFQRFLKYPDDVSTVLANICCKGENLVQGALTSSYIATLCLWDTEGDTVKKLKNKGLRYTRLVDDITISSKVFKYDFSFAQQVVQDMLTSASLPLNLGKTRIQNSSIAPLIVHGLRVDFAEPRLPPDEPKRIRAGVKNLEIVAAAPGYRASHAYRKDFAQCLGRVAKLQRVGHSQYGPLLDRLRKILPLPSHKDLDRVEMQVSGLEKDSLKPGYKESFWFYKRYHQTGQRIGVLKRSFPKKAAELRKRLTVLQPLKKFE